MIIDEEVKRIVDGMRPRNLAQRTALENSLQRKRDTAKDIERGLAQLANPTFTGDTVGKTMIRVPKETLVAIVKSMGGSITLDEHDLLYAVEHDEEVEFIQYADPRKIVLRIKEASDAGDGSDSGGYHGFTGVH